MPASRFAAKYENRPKQKTEIIIQGCGVPEGLTRDEVPAGVGSDRFSSHAPGRNGAVGLRDEKREEAARYRRAAEEALDQVAWAIRYLERIQKRDVAAALATNHSLIRRRLNAV